MRNLGETTTFIRAPSLMLLNQVSRGFRDAQRRRPASAADATDAELDDELVNLTAGALSVESPPWVDLQADQEEDEADAAHEDQLVEGLVPLEVHEEEPDERGLDRGDAERDDERDELGPAASPSRGLLPGLSLLLRAGRRFRDRDRRAGGDPWRQRRALVRRRLGECGEAVSGGCERGPACRGAHTVVTVRSRTPSS